MCSSVIPVRFTGDTLELRHGRTTTQRQKTMTARKRTNKSQKKVIQWVILIVGACGVMCAVGFGLAMYGNSISTPAPVPTINPDTIQTMIIETSQALNNDTPTVPVVASTAIPSSPVPEPIFTEPTAVVLPTVNFQPSGGISTSQFPCVPNNPQQTGRVVDVVDGDTIKVKMDADGQTYTVRYIGMDTPEATTSTEFYGPEATVKNLELVSGKTVTLIKDVSETDRY